MEPRAATPKAKLTTDHKHRVGVADRTRPEGRFIPRRKPRHAEQAITNYLRGLKS